jgi:hypothetical protein
MPTTPLMVTCAPSPRPWATVVVTTSWSWSVPVPSRAMLEMVNEVALSNVPGSDSSPSSETAVITYE